MSILRRWDSVKQGNLGFKEAPDLFEPLSVGHSLSVMSEWWKTPGSCGPRTIDHIPVGRRRYKV